MTAGPARGRRVGEPVPADETRRAPWHPARRTTPMGPV